LPCLLLCTTRSLKGEPMKLRTIIACGKVRPHIVEEITKAANGSWIPVDGAELREFEPLHIIEPEEGDKGWKTVILYDKQRFSPDTLRALEDAPNGAIMKVKPEELGRLYTLTVHGGEFSKYKAGKKHGVMAEDVVEDEIVVQPQYPKRKPGRPKGSKNRVGA